MRSKLQQTIDCTASDAAARLNSNDGGHSILELQHPAATRNSSQQNRESTRKLLYRRLLFATTAMVCILVSLKVIGVAFAGAYSLDFLTQLSTVVVLLGVIAVLYRTPQASMRLLRIAETVAGIAIAVDFIWVLVIETDTIVAMDETERLAEVFMTLSFALAIFIATYGMFIPGQWRRTAVITGMFALIPATTAIVLRQIHPTLQQSDGFPGFVAPLFTMLMAIASTLTTRIVNQLRREVETAKRYGQYHLLDEIGRGGMGVVYKARHRMLKRPAAIKLIRNEFANKPETITEFEHEVQLSAELTHWNSVQIYDYGRTEEGDFYYVMELLEGENLLSRIHRRSKLSNSETANIISQVCDGLQEAHLKGMVHRDIKPANIFLAKNVGQQDVVKILDFGLAAMKSETDRLQKVSGSPSYMSPEQITAKSIDERCDIYAVGCVIFECLTGYRLFIGDTINELLNQHLHQKPSLADLPESASQFGDVIAKCLEKEPNRRFPNVAALKDAIGRCI
ncbi:MAG: serine/threonine protein kinase [Pirellulaceae bacterium]|nr:serine/threonine protein kinase [Pirellulaceae bacterium]